MASVERQKDTSEAAEQRCLWCLRRGLCEVPVVPEALCCAVSEMLSLCYAVPCHTMRYLRWKWSLV